MITRQQINRLITERGDLRTIRHAQSHQHERLICTDKQGVRLVFAADERGRLIEIDRSESHGC